MTETRAAEVAVMTSEAAESADDDDDDVSFIVVNDTFHSFKASLEMLKAELQCVRFLCWTQVMDAWSVL